MENFFDPPIEELEIVLIEQRAIEQAQRQVVGCEVCSPEEAEVPFDWLLDKVTGRDPSRVDYLMEVPARCSYCGRQITEKTLVVALSVE